MDRLVILVDDTLALRMLTNGALIVDDDQVATTCSWWWRLTSALHGGRGGFLSRRIERQPPTVRQSLEVLIERLDQRLHVVDLRRLIPVMGPAAGVHRLNFLAAEALTAAVLLGADIVVGQDTPRLREAARVRGITYLVEA